MALFIIFGAAFTGFIPGILICQWLGIDGGASAEIVAWGWLLTLMDGWKLAAVVGRPPPPQIGETRDPACSESMARNFNAP